MMQDKKKYADRPKVCPLCGAAPLNNDVELMRFACGSYYFAPNEAGPDGKIYWGQFRPDKKCSNTP